MWVLPIGAHWIDKCALYPILIRLCQCNIYMMYSQYLNMAAVFIPGLPNLGTDFIWPAPYPLYILLFSAISARNLRSLSSNITVFINCLNTIDTCLDQSNTTWSFCFYTLNTCIHSFNKNAALHFSCNCATLLLLSATHMLLHTTHYFIQ